MTLVSTANVEQMAITSIVVGTRRRTKLGNIRKLAQSIAAHGLIHPLLVRGNELIAGARRLEACRTLGWSKVPVRRVERMTDDELRAVELDENIHREALNDYDASKAKLAEIRQAEADAKREAAEEKTRGDVPQVSRKPKRGPARTAGSKRDVEEKTGTSARTAGRVERHVAIAEAYPFMKRPDWRMHHVLEAGPLIEKLPMTQRVPIAALLDQDAIPPKRAIEMLTFVGEHPDRRGEIIRLARSSDPFERRRALTMIGEVEAPPDPGLVGLLNVADQARKAAHVCRRAEFQPQIAALADTAQTLATAFKDAEQRDKEQRHAEAV